MNTSGYQVKVTNKNDFVIREMFDGIPYVLMPKEPVNIPYDAACHIFGVRFAPGPEGHPQDGLREAIFNHVVRRWGWNRSEIISTGKHMAWFDKIEFKLIALSVVEAAVVDDEKQPLPQPRASIFPPKRGVGRPAKPPAELPDEFVGALDEGSA